MPYPRELYTADRYRVVHGPEEHQEFLKKGWVEDMPEDHPYVPHTVPLAADESAGNDAPKRRGPGRPKAE